MRVLHPERTPPLNRYTSALFPLAGSLLILSMAGCGVENLANVPLPTGPVTINLPGGSIQFPGAKPPVSGGGGSTDGGATTPTLPAQAPTVPSGSTGIKVYVNDVLAPASSYMLTTNRNHTSDNFPNGAAKLEKMKELRPTWGAARYMYRIGHGPTDGRHDYNYMTGYHFEQSWNKNGGYPYDDLRNALKEANSLDAEQLHVVNFGTGTPEEAGRYVSYLNNPDDANRKQYPFPVQNAKFFEIGNEISWSTVRGHSEYASTETKYAQRAKLYAQAMRKSSPTPIKIGAVATTNSNWLGDGWSGGAATVKNILTTMGTDVDFLIYHGYPSWPLKKDGDLLTIMAQNAWNDNKLRTEIVPAIKQYAKHPVYIANTEFFTEQYNDAAKSRGMFGALYSADTLTLGFNHAMIIANQFCLDHGELSDAAFFYNNDANQVTPIFQFQKMLAKNWGDSVLKTEGQAIPTVHVNGASANLDMPKLAFTASKASNGKVYVMVTNRTNDSDVSTHVALGFTPKQVTAHTLRGNSGWNSTTDVYTTSTAASLSGAYTFPKASVTILEVTP